MQVRISAALALLLVLCAPAGAARAGVYADELSKCLVSSATQKDQSQLIVWMFSAMTYHPDVKAYANVSDAQRQSLAADAGKLMQRLLVADCRKQSVAALKYEGPGVIESSFSILGQVAMRGLMNEPAVNAGMSHLADGLDRGKFEALAAEAGIPASATPK